MMPMKMQYCYIQLSEKISPTNAQYTSLIKWIDNLNNNIHLEVGNYSNS